MLKFIPKFKTPKFDRDSGSIMNFEFCELPFFKICTKIQNSTAAAVEFQILNFAIYRFKNCTKTHNSKFDRDSGRILNFEFCELPFLIYTKIQS